MKPNSLFLPDTLVVAPPVAVRRTAHSALAVLLMLVSGAAGLAWQLVWTAQLAPGLGHEVVAMLAVLAAFFAGLALGALLLGGRVERSRQPAHIYAACELVIALWGALLAWQLPAWLPLATGWIGAQPTATWHWTLAFLLPLLALLPATLAMGATLPALERVMRQASAGAWLAPLYAANTLGAVLGVLTMVFALIPHWGLQQSGWIAALLNLGCAGLAGALPRARVRDGEPAGGGPDPARAGVTATTPVLTSATPNFTPIFTALRLFATGFLGVAFEVLATRVLSEASENTVYSFALLLAVYLLATAAGAVCLSRVPVSRLWPLLAASVAVSLLPLWWAPVIAQQVLQLGAPWPAAIAAVALASEALPAALVMTGPALCMGALFTRLCGEAQQQRWPLGRAVAINLAGGALAPLLVGGWCLPQLGAGTLLACVALGYLLLGVPATRWAARPAAGGWRASLSGTTVLSAFTAITLVVQLVWLPPLRLLDLAEGTRLLSYRDGVMAAVSVDQDGQGIAHLRINNRVQEGSSAGSAVEMRLALLPLLLHPHPVDALLLGLGTGFTARVAAQDPGLHVTSIELLPEVAEAAQYFAQAPDAPVPAVPFAVQVADARRFVQASDHTYDVVIADLFHPARNGAGALYTVEQFRAVQARLRPQGLFCQWLAIHQMDLATLDGIIAAFVEVFPQGVAVLASNSLDTPVLGLIAVRDGSLPTLTDVQQRLAAAPPPVQPLLATTGLDTPVAVLGSVLADAPALRASVAGVRANSDDRPRVIFDAPWNTYAPVRTPRARLAALLARWPAPASVSAPTSSAPASVPADVSTVVAEDRQRTVAWRQARAAYLQLGLRTAPAADPQVMLDRVQAPLLAILAISPEFQPAAAPLQALAAALNARQPARAADLQRRLQAVAGRRQHWAHAVTFNPNSAHFAPRMP